MSVEAHLLEEQSCQISSQSDLKRCSLRLLFIHWIILSNRISSVVCCTAPLQWLHGHVMVPYKLSYCYYYFYFLFIYY